MPYKQKKCVKKIFFIQIKKKFVKNKKLNQAIDFCNARKIEPMMFLYLKLVLGGY